MNEDNLKTGGYSVLSELETTGGRDIVPCGTFDQLVARPPLHDAAVHRCRKSVIYRLHRTHTSRPGLQNGRETRLTRPVDPSEDAEAPVHWLALSLF